MSMKKFTAIALCGLLVFVIGSIDSVFAPESSTSTTDLKVSTRELVDAKITTISILNPAGFGSQIYGLDVYVSSGIKIKSATAPSGWAVKIKDGVVSFDAKGLPISEGSQGIFIIDTDLVLTSIYYEAYDSGNTLLSDQIVPVSAAGYSQLPYTNDLYGFSIAYPEGWLAVENANINGYTAIVAFSGPSASQYGSKIMVKTDDLKGASFSDYVQGAKDGLASALESSDYILLDEGKTRVNGNSAYFFEYTINAGLQVKSKMMLVDYGNTVYIVMYATSQDQYGDGVKYFDKGVSTLEISKDVHKDEPIKSGSKL